jgi:hypothetical protein
MPQGSAKQSVSAEDAKRISFGSLSAPHGPAEPGRWKYHSKLDDQENCVRDSISPSNQLFKIYRYTVSSKTPETSYEEFRFRSFLNYFNFFS